MLYLQEATRIGRVAALTRLFILRRELTTAEAAEKFGVSRRTIQRDFSEMAHQLPIYPDYTGRWVYAPSEGEVSISPY